MGECVSGAIETRLGEVTLAPSGPIVAGSVGQWTLTYVAGGYGIDEGGTIKISRRFASDWESPQFDRPTEQAYSSVRTNGDARLAVRYDPKAHERPWMKCIVIDVYDGNLAPGDTVTIVLGDRSRGSPGIRAQSFQESAHEFRVLVDPTNACVARRLPSSPVVPIVTGEPVTIVCVVPTPAAVGRAVDIVVRGEDRWGNPTSPPDGLELSWEGDAATRIEGRRLTFRQPGAGVVIALAGEMTFRSNPITATVETPALKRYWGDLHAQSDATVGTGTEEEYFTFARDRAFLDFVSHQGNDFQVTDEDWRRLNETVRAFHEDGRFVVFPGYEWSANTACGGDRNVIYIEEGLPIFRSCHWQVPDVPEDDKTPAHPANVLFERIRAHCPDKAVLVAHVGGRYADVSGYFDEEVGPLVEVASCWGVFEWLLWDALEAGHVVGVTCNSDGHKGRPGAESPGAGEFGMAGGLTCVLAEELTRRAVFDSLRNRRCYGTTGPRIDLSFEIDGRPMGSIVRAGRRATVEAAVTGAGPVESLTLYRQSEAVITVRPDEFANCGDSPRVRVAWGGARMRGRGRRVDWTGSIRVEGAEIVSASPHAFDSPADGITGIERCRAGFRSHTTGDPDGVDLLLDQARRGKIIFESKVGGHAVDVGDLPPDCERNAADFGGLGMFVSVQRYPETPSQRCLSLRAELQPPPGQTTAYYVKVLQSDGHMAWSSPIYLRPEA